MDGLPRSGSRPRVLIVGTEALNLRLPLMDQLVSHGFDPCAAGALPQPEFDDSPYDYYQYPVCRSVSLRGFQQSVTTLREVIKEARPDVARSQYKAMSGRSPGDRSLGIPCVRTVTETGSAFSSDELLYRPDATG